ncbi:MAG: LysR substrate-binding domain-containing protein, partial [Coriobacteriales bacterium]
YHSRLSIDLVAQERLLQQICCRFQGNSRAQQDTAQSEDEALNDTQLMHFLAVYDAASYSAAANTMFTSRQVLGRSVANLEKEVGGKLFTHKGRGIEPTPLGDKTAELARGIINDIIEIKRIAAEEAHLIAEERPYTVALASHGPRGVPFSSEALLLSLKRRLPHQAFTIEELACESCSPALDAGLVDAVVILGGLKDPQFINRQIGDCRPCIALSANNPLAQRSSLYLEDLRHQRFAQPDSLSYFLPFWEDMCARRGFLPQWHYAGKEEAELAQFIAAGGIGVVIKNSPFVKACPQLCIVPLDASEGIELSFYVVFRKDHRSTIDSAVYGCIKEFIR